MRQATAWHVCTCLQSRLTEHKHAAGCLRMPGSLAVPREHTFSLGSTFKMTGKSRHFINYCAVQGHTKWVTSVAWEPAHRALPARRFVSGSQDKSLRVWDAVQNITRCLTVPERLHRLGTPQLSSAHCKQLAAQAVLSGNCSTAHKQAPISIR